MVKTHGLTHINLAVRDPDRSLRFYRDVFGVVEQFTPGFPFAYVADPDGYEIEIWFE